MDLLAKMKNENDKGNLFLDMDFYLEIFLRDKEDLISIIYYINRFDIIFNIKL